MSFFNYKYCQICERFITKEQFNKHLYSNRPLHRELNGYWPTSFPQTKLGKDGKNVLEKAFWKMFFLQLEVLEVEEFWLTYATMTTNMKDYMVENNGEDLGKVFRDTMKGQSEHDLYIKSFSNQLESDDEVDTLQQRIEWWRVVVDKLGIKPNVVYDYTFANFYMLYHKTIDHER